MDYTELIPKPAEQLTRDEGRGWILEDGKRVISFRAKTFQALADRLTNLLGAKVASIVLYQMGNAIGHAGMSYSRSKIESESQLGTVLDSVLGLRGWGRCVRLTWNKMGTRYVYVFTMKGSPFCHERTSNEPTCHMMRGVLGGWLEAYFDKKATDSAERECESTGHEFCVFEIIFDTASAGAA